MSEKVDSLSSIDKNLKLSLFLNSGFTIFEFAIGISSGSLALVSDATHNLTDSLSIVISYSANKMSKRKTTDDKTYGYGRATILAALINSLILVGVALYIFYEAYTRILKPEPVSGRTISFVAFIGMIVNGTMALILFKNKKDLNAKSLFLNMAMDAVALVGTLVAGVLIIFTNQTIFDPLISILIGIMLLFAAWGVVKDSLHILLEGVPEGVDIEKVKELLGNEPLVKNIDDLHIWAISSSVLALSCHLVIEECDLDKSMEIVNKIKQQLKEQFGIQHITIETELVNCPPNTN